MPNGIVSNQFSKVLPAAIFNIGMIIPIAHTTIPDGWLECNGSQVSRVTYSELFNKIGTTYGSGDGSTTFGLPDLRACFIRGLDRGRGVDSNRQLGQEQLDDIKAHTHPRNPSARNESIPEVVSGGPTGYATTAASTVNVLQESTTGSTGGTETRPRNVALIYIIKAKNIAGTDVDIIGANADTVDGLHSRDFLLASNGLPAAGISNLVVTNTATAITLTASCIALYSASDNRAKTLYNVNVTGNPTLAASTSYYLWLVYTNTTSTTSLVLTTTYTAPAGYDYYRYIGGRFTDSSSKLYIMRQFGCRVDYVLDGTVLTVASGHRKMASGLVGSQTTPTWIAVSVSSYVPTTACQITIQCGHPVGGIIVLAPNMNYGAVANTTNNPYYSVNIFGTNVIMPLESTNIYWASSDASNYIACSGWTENL